jgi:acyl-CoA thioesterase I
MDTFRFGRRSFLTAVVSILLVFPDCSKLLIDRPVDVLSIKGTIRVACIGNSITYGYAIDDRENNSYPAQLDRLLPPQWDVRNFGVSGATLLKKGDKPYWEESEFQKALAFKPHVVVIKLGTNDSKPQNWVYNSQFEDDYCALIEQFKALDTQPRIWICLPVPAYDTRWSIRGEIITGEVIPAIRHVAAREQVPLIDLYTPLSGKETLFPDKIHPNTEGSGIIAREVKQALTGN